MKEIGILLGALIAAIAAAGLIVVIFAPEVEAPAPAPPAARTATVATALRISPVEEVEVVAEPVHRAVPIDILRTASIAAAPFNPGIRLVRTLSIKSDWASRRAEIEDRLTRDVRAYAIGDLLPYGSLLVGVSTAAVDVLVGDAHLIRLHADDRIEEVEDLSAVYEPTALPVAKFGDVVDADAVRLALIDLRSDDPTVVQTAIDDLIAAGDPAIDLLVPHADDILPVRSAEYAFPSGSELQIRPKVSGVIVMMVLERITGQTFGDLTKEELSDDDRRAIASAWRRFLP